MICLLDTNVLSQRMAKLPEDRVLRFLEELPQEQAFLSVVTMLEIRAGIENPKTGARRRAELEAWLTVVLPDEYADRILPVTLEIADEAGRMLAREKSFARTPYLPDLLLAATAKTFGMAVATLNRKHFETLGVELVEFR